jgi:hypothetical protein
MLEKFIKPGGSSMPESDILSWLEEGQFGRYFMYQEIIRFTSQTQDHRAWRKQYHNKAHVQSSFL